MNTSQTRRALRYLIFLAVAAGLTACRKKPPTEEAGKPIMAIEIHPSLTRNAIGELPGPVYQSQKDSVIDWQPWSKETFERSRNANRLVFAVWAMPQQEGFVNVLEALGKSSEVVNQIRENYVPVLLDADAAREMSLLSGELCAEIRRSVAMPMFVFFTPDLCPVGWLPVDSFDDGQIAETFDQIDSMVSQTWRESPDYVIKNSQTDQTMRRERMAERVSAVNPSQTPDEDTLRGIRQLASLYDSTTGNIDEAGGLFPAGAVNLLALAAWHPLLPDELKARCLESTRGICGVLQSSPLIDPLDGGVFSGRSGSGVTLPNFQRDCATQARVAIAFLDAYRATGDRSLLHTALRAIEFAEQTFQTEAGLFCVGTRQPTDAKSWLWTVEEIKELLEPEDAVWWIEVMGMRGLGNIAPEADPSRVHFRNNSLAWKQSPELLIKQSGISREEFEARLSRISKRLLETRAARIGAPIAPQSAHLASTLRMVCAYAHAYVASGRDEYRQKASDTLKRVRDTFWNGSSLRVFEQEVPAPIGEGRAFHYALALLAAGDVFAVTLDESWLEWCEDVATVSSERFTGNGFLRESGETTSLIDLPIQDYVMLFDESTAGLISMAEVRLTAGKRPMLKRFSDLAVPLPVKSTEYPILYTDILSSTLARTRNITALAGAGLKDGQKDVLTKLPLRMVQRRMALPDDGVPEGTIRIIGLTDDPLDITEGMALPASLSMPQS